MVYGCALSLSAFLSTTTITYNLTMLNLEKYWFSKETWLFFWDIRRDNVATPYNNSQIVTYSISKYSSNSKKYRNTIKNGILNLTKYK